ncbi:MAG: hypothetical protein ACFFDN_31875, partial [Candidatus Hodarchaeota archaeon]
FLFKIIKNKIKTVIKDIFIHDIWNIGLIEKPIQMVLEKDFKLKIHWFPKPKKDRFYADPFGIRLKNKNYILFEEFSFKNNRGIISFYQQISNNYTGPQTSISMPFHLSYPFLINHEGKTFCIPESYEANKIIIYKALDFPSKWSKGETLINSIAATDPTIYRYKGKWWLFCSKFSDLPIINLYIFYSDELNGPWIGHPLNPVKSDVISSRPAGTPFIYNGKLIRPAQDCSKTYGSRIVLNEVRKLTETEFEEKVIKVIETERYEKYNKGIHTLSSIGTSTLIDGRRYGFRRDLFKIKLLDHKKATNRFLKNLIKTLFRKNQ